MDEIDDSTIDLIVTSPPYPMIEMWDGVFENLDPLIGDYLEAGEGMKAFESMHRVLKPIWQEVDRVAADGAIICINIGDSTRSIGGEFQLFPNRSKIVETFLELGYSQLPSIVWRKPTNAKTKFMGSGMLPTNQYVTLEHEHILTFRKGGTRDFDTQCSQRKESAYFWEERNQWFADCWDDVVGITQSIDDTNTRDRSAAYPLEIPFRLINMYSVYEDTVLDPFWGTGTTTIAAMVAGRDSIGYELDESLQSIFAERIDNIQAATHSVIRNRIESHLEFIEQREESGYEFQHQSTHYNFPVMTAQETDICFYEIESVQRSGSEYSVCHSKYEPDGLLYTDDSGHIAQTTLGSDF